MYRLALTFILCITVTACSSDNYYYASSSASLAGSKRIDITQNTPEAAEARKYATAEILNKWSPDTCSFNQHQNIYQCDDEEVATAINTRVAEVRKKMDLFHQLNGFPSNSRQEKDLGGNLSFGPL